MLGRLQLRCGAVNMGCGWIMNMGFLDKEKTKKSVVSIEGTRRARSCFTRTGNVLNDLPQTAGVSGGRSHGVVAWEAPRRLFISKE